MICSQRCLLSFYRFPIAISIDLVFEIINMMHMSKRFGYEISWNMKISFKILWVYIVVYRSDNSLNYFCFQAVIILLQFVFLIWNNINKCWIFSASYDSFFLKNYNSSFKDDYLYMDCFERNSMSASLFILFIFLKLKIIKHKSCDFYFKNNSIFYI